MFVIKLREAQFIGGMIILNFPKTAQSSKEKKIGQTWFWVFSSSFPSILDQFVRCLTLIFKIQKGHFVSLLNLTI